MCFFKQLQTNTTFSFIIPGQNPYIKIVLNDSRSNILAYLYHILRNARNMMTNDYDEVLDFPALLYVKFRATSIQ